MKLIGLESLTYPVKTQVNKKKVLVTWLKLANKEPIIGLNLGHIQPITLWWKYKCEQ